MNDASDERCKLVMSLEALLYVLLLHEVVKGLHGVDNVCHIVEWVFFEIARLNLFCEIDQVLKFDVIEFEKVELLENLVADKL